MGETLNGLRYLKGVTPQDQFRPYPSKNEWGADILTRELRASPAQMTTFFAELSQGNTYSAIGVTFYLQTWQEINDPIWPGVKLMYKGLLDGIPDAHKTNSRVELSSTINAGDLSISYNGKTIVSATKEIQYIAPQTVYRYIATAEPTSTTQTTVGGGTTITIRNSKITVTYSDGTTQQFAGSVPAALATALTVSPAIEVYGPSAAPIIGSPWWEVEEILQYKYPSE